MAKFKIDSRDKERVLLTELLPYEVPMLFSNEGLYSLVKTGKYDHFFDRIVMRSGALGEGKKKYGIPYVYKIRKNVEGDTRDLAIIHPYCQVHFIELYEKYHLLMVHLSSRSPFSLRRVSKVAKAYYGADIATDENTLKSADKENEIDVLSNDTKFLKSYFVYEPFDLIFKFYDSESYQRLEQRFNFMMQFDVSKCFYNIYTHSITWAVKNKEVSKKNARRESFENTFDKLMQLSNYNETNGIVVGPEISRIFAEIILQKIDLNVLSKIEKKHGCRFGIDFEVRRYVDDYFVFANDQSLLTKIRDAFKDELGEYKLYLNPGKDEVNVVPFVTDRTVGNRELDALLNSIYERVTKRDVIDDNGKMRYRTVLAKTDRSVAKNFIADFQCIVKRNRLQYDVLSKDVIRFFNRRLSAIFSFDVDNSTTSLDQLITTIIELIFYAYSLNINSNTTFKLAQIILMINNYYALKKTSRRNHVLSHIFSAADFVLTNFHRKTRRSETDMETLNLVIALKQLGNEFRFTESRIRELFNVDKSDFMLNYFQIVTLFYYMDNDIAYSSLRLDLQEHVEKKFSIESDPFSKSELTLLFFDYICCPFVDIKSKRKVVNDTKYASKGQSVEDVIEDISSQGSFFMNWDSEVDLEYVLKKKKWGTSY